MEEIKKNENESVKNDAPKPGTKAYVEAELAVAKAELEAAKAELEAQKTREYVESEGVADAAEAGPKMVKIRIPRTKADQEDVFVSVNNYTCIIKRGVEVEVPDFVAEVLQHQEEMLEEIMLFEDAAQKKNK